ncbi:MAG: hypothetical protein HOE85_00285 [Nitrospinaceae bacterium]|jgi:hypothetical protein|nr:hypothetical protein [Nitrospinaceae bacterium]
MSFTSVLKKFYRKHKIGDKLESVGLRSCVSALVSPRTSYYFQKDYWSYRLKYAALLAPSRDKEEESGIAIIIGIHNSIPSAKEEGIYGRVLNMRGYTPVCLISRGSPLVKYYKLYGVKKYEIYEDLTDRFDLTPFVAEMEMVLAEKPSYRDLIYYLYRGVHVGRHVLSWMSRVLHQGTVALERKPEMEMFQRLFPEALRNVHAAEALYDKYRPSAVMFNEHGYTPFGEFFDVSHLRQQNTILWCASHRDDSRMYKRYTTDTCGVHPSSLSEGSWESLKSHSLNEESKTKLLLEHKEHYCNATWFNFQRIQHDKIIKTKKEIVSQLGLNPEKKNAFIFAHILWDATFFYGESLFDDYAKWLVETVKAACNNDTVNWVVKLHPVNVWRREADGYTGEYAENIVLRDEIYELPAHVKILPADTDINTFSLFDAADFCITVRGTIGIEMALYGVPVFTAGTSHYSEREFTIDSSTQEEYLDRLSKIQEYPPMDAVAIELAQKYAYGLFLLRPFPFTSFNMRYSAEPGIFHPLNGKPEFHVASRTQLDSATDLNRLADWVLESDELDLLSR